MNKKTDVSHWYDLFPRRMTRRDMLRVSADVSGLVALGALTGCGPSVTEAFRSDPFSLGVASGDPTPDGVVLWTRLGRAAVEDAQGALVPVAQVVERPGGQLLAGAGLAGDQHGRLGRGQLAETREHLAHAFEGTAHGRA